MNFLKSRTFWTIVVMFVVGGGNAIVPVMPADFQAVVMFALSGLATYFHVNPSQNYNAQA